MLKVTSQRLDIRPRPEDYPDLIDISQEDFPEYEEVGMPSPFPADMSATMTLNPGPDRKLSIQEIQQQVAQMDATLTIIKKQLHQLVGN